MLAVLLKQFKSAYMCIFLLLLFFLFLNMPQVAIFIARHPRGARGTLEIIHF